MIGAIIEQLCAALNGETRQIDLRGANLEGADLGGANLEGPSGLRLEGMPDPMTLRGLVADHIEKHPELHNQAERGDGRPDPTCGTPCCVAGWACHLGGGAYGLGVANAAICLLWVAGKPLPPFGASASREEILEALRS